MARPKGGGAWREWARVALAVTGLAAAAVAARPLSAQAPTAAAPARREGHVEVPGARLFYVDSGGPGPAVIMLHAGTGSARVWEHQWDPFGGAGYRVIAYDRRGYGRTTTAPSSAPPVAAADDLHALAAQLQLDRFHLVGTAAGGIVAIDFALTYPERLRSLVVANSLGGVTDEAYLALGRRLRPKEFAALPPDLRELGPAYRAANPDGTDRWLALEGASRAPGPLTAAATVAPARHVPDARRPAGADLAPHRRRRHVHAAGRAAAVRGAHPRCRLGGPARRRAFGLLGGT